MAPKLNMRSSSVKRILQEHQEFLNDPSEDFVAAPLEEDIFEWHVTVKGSIGSDYEGGIYHLRITLPPQYPLSPPDITLLTPTGRFEVNKKICIDGLTSFHKGSWRPVWGVRTAIVGLMSFWNQNGEALAAIGALNCGKEEKKRLANLSGDWTCPTCQMSNKHIFVEHENAIEAAKKAKSETEQKVDKGKSRAVEADENLDSPEKVESKTEEVVPVQNPIENQSPSSSIPATPSQHSVQEPTPSPIISAILTPPPRSLAFFRLAHYYLTHLFLPQSMRHHLPSQQPDDLLFIDSAIQLFAVATILIIGIKLWKSWDKIIAFALLMISRGIEKVFGAEWGFFDRAAVRGDRQINDQAHVLRRARGRIGPPDVNAEGRRMPRAAAPAEERRGLTDTPLMFAGQHGLRMRPAGEGEHVHAQPHRGVDEL